MTDCTLHRGSLAPSGGGTSQRERFAEALDPSYAPVDGRSIGHGIVFARSCASFINFFNTDNVTSGNWQSFFGADLSVHLAVAAVQDVSRYRARVKELFDFLKDLDTGHPSDEEVEQAKEYLGYLFSVGGSVARELDHLTDALPPEHSLKGWLQNSIRSQLAPMLRRLISYYKGDQEAHRLDPSLELLITDVHPEIYILGAPAAPFSELYERGLSSEWRIPGGDTAAEWTAYREGIDPDLTVFGTGTTAVRINHIATHNLFTSIFDTFLKAYARLVSEAEQALEDSLTRLDSHEPHYALFLAFLRLMEHARREANTITQRHLDFYYREILQLKEKPAQPGRVHLLVELAKNALSREVPEGALFKAGKDDLGKEVFFASDAAFVANQGKVSALKCVFSSASGILASPVADSDDGAGGEIVAPDMSWHPFHTMSYREGKVSETMPKAELGFALASHYFLLGEGERTVSVTFVCSLGADFSSAAFAKLSPGSAVVCSFTGEKGWFEVRQEGVRLAKMEEGLALTLTLSGADPAVVPCSAKVHGDAFQVELPTLLVRLRQEVSSLYPLLRDTVLDRVEVAVTVTNVRNVTVADDFGSIDPSKAFQPFGPAPKKGGSLIIGSRELFQKKLASADVEVEWQTLPVPYESTQDAASEVVKVMAAHQAATGMAAKETVAASAAKEKVSAAAKERIPQPEPVPISVEYLSGGVWYGLSSKRLDSGESPSSLFQTAPAAVHPPPFVDAADLSEPEQYGSSSRYGFIRLRIGSDLGDAQYREDLIDYIKRVSDTRTDNDKPVPTPPVVPVATRLSLSYTATQTLDLSSAGAEEGASFQTRGARFLHVAPFGHAEQHPHLKREIARVFPALEKKIHLLPQFSHEADGHSLTHEGELYLGVSGFKPPRNLALLFQVADGTSDPLAAKPEKHLHWSYLRGNEWLPFAPTEVADGTAQLLKSGIVTFSIPRNASDDNTLLPSGMHWIRCAVAEKSEAVCRLIKIAPQALEATFADRGNDPAFPAKVLPPGTITRLDEPDAAVKKIAQPFSSFGGRGKEASSDFYTRVSERLRHKDRGIALWDYERLVLEAFPQIYQARFLNHTFYGERGGKPIYSEGAPGHVTIVTVPNQQISPFSDPLKPYTSHGVREEIRSFLRRRLSCFVQLHVENPQFEEVTVQCAVRFGEGVDETFSRGKMNEAIVRFLSPWAFSEGSRPSFGGTVHKSELINFVEELPYVDYVTDFLLFHTFNSETGAKEKEEGDEICGSRAISILVSAREHTLKPITAAAGVSVGEICASV